MKSLAALIQIELPAIPYPMILNMTHSTYINLVGTEEWRENIKSNIEQKRFEALMKTIGEATKAITKTVALVGEGIIKAR